MNLQGLPVEIICLIASYLPARKDVLLFALSSRRLSRVLLEFLYLFNIRYENSSVLHWASSHGKVTLLQKLFHSYQPNVNALQDTKTPLMCAVEYRCRSTFLLLMLRDDLDLNHEDRHGHNVLWYACSHGFTYCVERLLARRHFNVNAQDRDGRTLLTNAIRWGLIDVVRCLLTLEETDINLKDRWGRSPLDLAIRHNRFIIIQMLLADPRIVALDESETRIYSSY